MLKYLSFFLFLFCLSGNAQNKLFTLDDVISGGKNYTSFYPDNLKQLQWQSGTDAVTWIDDNCLMYQSVRSKSPIKLLTLNQLNIACSQQIDVFPSYTWFNQHQIRFQIGYRMYWFNPFKLKIIKEVEVPKNGSNLDYTSNFDKLAYVYNDNLYVKELASSPSVPKQITLDGGNGIVIGQSVHRNEFGITKGTFWSSTGSKLAFYRMNETCVSNYPLVDYTTRVAETKPIKYPMAGMKSHEVKIGVWNSLTDELVYLDVAEGEEEFYYTNISFTPDELQVSIALLNRAQNHMRFNLYSTETGALIRTVFEEKKNSYVEPEHAALFVPNPDNEFIWQSERSGHNHLYLYHLENGTCEPLTFGDWEVTRVLGFDKKGEKLFFESSITSPLETQLCVVDLHSKEILQLTQVAGTHKTILSSSGDYFIDSWSNKDVPRSIDIVSTSTKKIKKNLLVAANPYKDFALGETEIVTVLAADGKTTLYGRLIKPINFVASKKYPVIIYVYGGPHAQLVHNNWMLGARMWQHYMAQKGYVSFTLDNRGSAGRGQDFEDVIHRKLGVAEMADQVEGVNYLKSLPYVDADKIGVHGWSFGGFMTTSLLTHYPEIFKVGVAGGPVIDWKYYEIMYGERYMDSPSENVEGYEKSNVINYAKNLEGRLLIIHGAQDPTVVMQHSLAFVRECIKENKQVDYFVYPTHEHNVRGKDRVHLMDKVSRYFFDFLPSDR